MNDAGTPTVDMLAGASMSGDLVSNRDLVMGSQHVLHSFVNTSPGPFGSGIVVDGLAPASSNSMFGREVMQGNRMLLGNLFDDFVRIPRSEYDELRSCKDKAGELLNFVLQMENHIKHKDVELASTQEHCADICDHVRNECVQKIEQITLQLRDECRQKVVKTEQSYSHALRMQGEEFEKRCVEYDRRIKLYELSLIHI